MSGDEESMEDMYRSMAQVSEEEMAAQMEAHLAQMAAQGYDKVEGPILQYAKATALPGRRDELLEVLKRFQPIVTQEESTLMYGHFPDIDDPDVIHSIQVYESWDVLCAHMREMKYNQFVVPVMSLSAPGSPEYSFGSCLFMHRGEGHHG
jgi:quinol monooxygenase YgiN